MVIGLLIVSAIPTTVGVSQAISAQKKANAAEKEKAKFHIGTTELSIDGGPAEEPFVVLSGGKLYIDHPNAPRPGHKFTGFYFTYPSEAQLRGLVSSIQEDPPILNWIYVDKDTGALRYGGRKDTTDHIIGPFSWSTDEQWLTLEEESNRFIAVEEEAEDRQENRKWAVYLARRSDGKLSKAQDKVQELCDGDEEGTNESVDVRDSHRWAPIKLRRRMQMGMESKYVKGDKQ